MNLLAIPAVLLATSPSLEIRPSFEISTCAWYATYVVVATEGKEIDGNFEVTEVWWGDLKVGAKIHVAGMEKMAPKAMRSEPFWFDPKKKRVAIPCDRTVLFLRKVEGEYRTAHRSWRPPGSRRRGDPTHYDHDITLSAAWIHRGKVYARVQVMNPGEQMMTSLDMKEAKFRGAVLARLVERDAIASLGKVTPLDRRAAGLERFLRVKSYPARRTAMAYIQTCGKAALPALRRLLHDDDHMHLSRNAALAIAKIDRSVARTEVTAVIRKDFEFFRKEAEGLAKGWWNDQRMKPDRRRRLHDHHGRLYYLLYELGRLGGKVDRELIADIREFWMSKPQLTDLDQVPNTCHGILENRKPSRRLRLF